MTRVTKEVTALFLSSLNKQGEDVEKLEKEMDQVIIKTICWIQPTLAHAYKSCQPEDVENSMCFEILGFDILIDTKMKPWVLEVNISPSFSVDTPLDFRIKRGVIEESIKLLNLSYKRKLRFRKKEKSEFQKRVLTKRTERKTLEEKSLLKQNFAFKRNMKVSSSIYFYRNLKWLKTTDLYILIQKLNNTKHTWGLPRLFGKNSLEVLKSNLKYLPKKRSQLLLQFNQ